MKRLLLSAACGFALCFGAAPAAAQTVSSEEPSAEELEALGDLFGDMFGTAEALSAEEEARLPAAMLVVSKLFPEGTYTRMMEDSMGPMMESMMGGMGANGAISLSALTGLSPLDLTELDSETITQAVALLDPAAEERNAAMTGVIMELTTELMLEIEPSYRAGLARAYATRFTASELTDLAAYFSTPVGGKYAAESFPIFADPQVMASMNELMPSIMQRMPDMMSAMTALEADFPKGRTYSDLSAQEQAKLAQLLGVSKTELADSEPEHSEQ